MEFSFQAGLSSQLSKSKSQAGKKHPAKGRYFMEQPSLSQIKRVKWLLEFAEPDELTDEEIIIAREFLDE